MISIKGDQTDIHTTELDPAVNRVVVNYFN